MDQVLQDLDGVVCFFNDIAIQGATEQELLNRLRKVLLRLRQHNLHTNRAKCQFFKSNISYLGHRIDKDGLHATEEKIAAIINSPPPSDVSQLRTFLGLVNYYQKFLPNLAAKLHPLHQFLKKKIPFYFNHEHNRA